MRPYAQMLPEERLNAFFEHCQLIHSQKNAMPREAKMIPIQKNKERAPDSFARREAKAFIPASTISAILMRNDALP